MISGFGYEPFQALLLHIPTGFIQLSFVLLATFLPTRVTNIRILFMLIATFVSTIGMAMVYAIDPAYNHARLSGYYLCAAYPANFPLGLSLVSSNVAGFTKKATVVGMMFVGYCAGNIIGPQFYLPDEAPTYTVGQVSLICKLLLTINL